VWVYGGKVGYGGQRVTATPTKKDKSLMEKGSAKKNKQKKQTKKTANSSWRAIPFPKPSTPILSTVSPITVMPI
jgi:hypothetical protein